MLKRIENGSFLIQRRSRTLRWIRYRRYSFSDAQSEYGQKLRQESTIGNAGYLPNGNRLKISVRIIEVTEDIPAREVMRLFLKTLIQKVT